MHAIENELVKIMSRKNKMVTINQGFSYTYMFYMKYSLFKFNSRIKLFKYSSPNRNLDSQPNYLIRTKITNISLFKKGPEPTMGHIRRCKSSYFITI